MNSILLQAAQDSAQDYTSAWIALAAAVLGSLVGGLATLFVHWLTQRDNTKGARRDYIRLQLNEFYGPYVELQEVAQHISDLFRKNRGKEFRTLIALLEGQTFDATEQVLLKEILELNKKRYELIMTKGGLVESAELQGLLQEAGAHFRIIQLAYEGSSGGPGLKGEVSRFEKYTYPNELNPLLKKKLEDLQQELRKLSET
jgi:hypothetical protein